MTLTELVFAHMSSVNVTGTPIQKLSQPERIWSLTLDVDPDALRLKVLSNSFRSSFTSES